MEDVMCHQITSPRVNTTHGKKKNQGMLAVVNSRLSLCFTEGQEQIITAYTPVEDILRASALITLPVVELDF